MEKILNNTAYKHMYFKMYAMLLFVSPASEPTRSTAPLFTERCPAGFPSPATDISTLCWRELSGNSKEKAVFLLKPPPPKQQIVCSRSFGERVTTYEAMRQAVYQYAERAAEKLRGERQFYRHIAVFVQTSPFAVNEPYYPGAPG